MDIFKKIFFYMLNYLIYGIFVVNKLNNAEILLKYDLCLLIENFIK